MKTRKEAGKFDLVKGLEGKIAKTMIHREYSLQSKYLCAASAVRIGIPLCT